MANATKTEAELIETMQEDIADVKQRLQRIHACAMGLYKINADAGRKVQASDAMIWAGGVMAAHGALILAHVNASKALVAGYDNGGEIMTRGPGR